MVGLRGQSGRTRRQGPRSWQQLSARNAYLRAAEYFRQAFFFHREDLDAIKLREAYAASVAAFQSALELLDHPGRALTGALSG